jgi:hypothetical protein
MPIKWFQGPSGEVVPVVCGPDGINVPSLAEKLKLKPRTVELNGLLVDFNSAGYLSLADTGDFLNGLGDSSNNAIPVTGQLAEAAERGVAGATDEPAPDAWAAMMRRLSKWNDTMGEKAAWNWMEPPGQQLVGWKKVL